MPAVPAAWGHWRRSPLSREAWTEPAGLLRPPAETLTVFQSALVDKNEDCQDLRWGHGPVSLQAGLMLSREIKWSTRGRSQKAPRVNWSFGFAAQQDEELNAPGRAWRRTSFLREPGPVLQERVFPPSARREHVDPPALPLLPRVRVLLCHTGTEGPSRTQPSLFRERSRFRRSLRTKNRPGCSARTLWA